jgi:hypothetical protein
MWGVGSEEWGVGKKIQRGIGDRGIGDGGLVK